MESKKANDFIADRLSNVTGMLAPTAVMELELCMKEAATIAENEMKEKATEVYKRNCRLYQPICLEGDKRPCTGGCEYLADFITELNKPGIINL